MWPPRRIRWIAATLGGALLVLSRAQSPAAQPLPREDIEFANDVFFVKLTNEASGKAALSKMGHVGRTGIASIDRLSENAGVLRIAPVFRYSPRFEARHRAYGLDRWYRFYTDGTQDIRAMLPGFSADPNVTTAELQAVPTLDVLPNEASMHSSDGSTARLLANDTLFSEQWHFDNTGQDEGTPDADIDLPEAWTIETGDPSVVVAVLDTGVDPDHPDLAPNIWHNPGEIPDNGVDDDENGYIDDTWGWDFFNDDNDPTYGEGHGSHTSGTVVAVTNNETGVSGIAGGWGPDHPGARVMVLAGHWGYPEAIVYAADNGATIASYSWSGTTFTFDIVEEVFRYFIETAEAADGSQPGGMIIFSAGNEGTTRWEYPKAYSGVIAVAATDRNDQVPYWSNRGDWVDMAAPGVTVLSTLIHGGYQWYSGTSMSAPHVAGAAALIRSARPDFPGAAVRYVLQQGADGIPASGVGGGRLNAYKSLLLATGNLPDLVTEPPDLNFRTVTLGTQRSMRVTLFNIGDADHTVSISSDNGRFEAGATQTLIPAHGKATFDVVFHPVQKSLETGTVTLQWDGPSIELALRGDAHEFTDHYVGLQDVTLPSFDWADYDADGILDLLLTGESMSRAVKERWAIIYRNNGDLSFQDVEAGFEGATNGAGTWIDFDNDGDFDVLLSGESTGLFDTRLYINDGDGSFRLADITLPKIVESAAAWADYDNDGDKDLALMGTDPIYNPTPDHYLKIFRNDAGRNLDEVISLPGASAGDLAWDDYDLDGDFDLVVCGWDRTTRATRLYRNDAGSFVDSGVALAAVKDCSVRWGDLDSDGDADLLLTGELSSGAPTTVIYRNDGGGSFSSVSGGLAPVRVGSGTMGDYDNDGDLDVLLTGFDGSNRIARIYRNEGALQFASIGEDFPGLATSQGSWVDADVDGDLDVFIAGQDPGGRFTLFYRNEDPHSANTRPGAPSIQGASVDGGEVTLSWSNGSDAETPTAALTYELRVGSIPGAGDIVAASAEPDGRRSDTNRGNAGHRRTWTIGDLENGTYYWTVQSIDSGFDGSAFAIEGSFTVSDSPVQSPDIASVTLRAPADSARGEPTTLALAWDPLTDAKYYQVEVSATADFGAPVMDETTVSHSVDFVAPVAERTYYWRVRGFRGSTVGEWSPGRMFTVGASGGYAPTLAFPPDDTKDIVPPLTLVWRSEPGVVSYEVQVASSQSFITPEIIRSGLVATTLQVSGLLPGKKYYWRVRGVGADGRGTWTVTRSFETLSIPAPVSLLRPEDGAVDQSPDILLEWEAGDLAESYQVQVDTSVSFLNPVVDDTVEGAVQIRIEEKLSGATTYWWRVRALNAAGSGEWSSSRHFTVASVTGTDDDANVPSSYFLYPLYPNPTADRFTLSFDVPRSARVRIRLFDVQGRRKADLLTDQVPAAHHVHTIVLPNLASGVYLVRMEADRFIAVRSILIVRN